MFISVQLLDSVFISVQLYCTVHLFLCEYIAQYVYFYAGILHSVFHF